MRRVVLLLLLLGAGMIGEAQQPRVLLAVFAHPDDEAFAMGPVLARYAREGVKVYLAIATQGEKGQKPGGHIQLGPPLAKVRQQEAQCACQKLGIEPPIFFELHDGELGISTDSHGKWSTDPDGATVLKVVDQVNQQVSRLNPQVVVTWGPEGGYGHPDHRLVSDAVTQVVQSSKSGVKLYYAELTTAQAKGLSAVFGIWPGVDPSYLPVSASYTKDDRDAYHQAFECHQSQFAASDFPLIENALDGGWGMQVSFREWNGGRQSQDLFK
jgi:LmbE family N-acetylglucosaminyl deacetylase